MTGCAQDRYAPAMNRREGSGRVRGRDRARCVRLPAALGLLLTVAGSCARTAGAGGPSGRAADLGAAPVSWDTAAVERAAPAAPAGTVRLVAVRTSAGPGVERLEFDFAPTLPAYRIGYQEGPARDCGTGEELPLAGATMLVVTFRGASAHDDAGRATIADRDRRPALRETRELRLTCDFEGVVAWAVGVADRPAFRVVPRDQPPHLLLELRAPRSPHS